MEVDNSDLTDSPKIQEPLFPGDNVPEASLTNLHSFSDDWWIAGADSAEHYQQILLDSTQSHRTWTNFDTAGPTRDMTTTAGASANGQVGAEEAAISANSETVAATSQTLPIRSRATPVDIDHSSKPLLPEVSDSAGSEINEPSIGKIRAPQQSVHESFDEIQLRLTNEFAPIVEHDWDTLIYIGAPAQEHGQDDDEYDYIKRHFSRPYLMKSATLRNTGSAEIAKLLGPVSARAQRRLKKLGLHLNLPGNREPTYYLDLRPPQDDDAAVEMVTEMSCTPGVLSWHKQTTLLGIDKAVIGGTDSLNIVGKTCANTVKRSSDQDLDGQPAYSPLRHHMAIERLLQTIGGESPKLNSAPKLWSFVVIAKYLGCAQHPWVVSEVYSWLFADRNSNFIQNNPEVTYRIARSLQARDLTRVTYALLVGEKACLQRGFKNPTDSTVPQKQPEMRPLCHIDDDEVNRIDHAARSFGSRIQSTYMKLANEPMPWMIGSTEVLKLLGLEAPAPKDQTKLTLAWTLLRDYVSDEIHQALTEDLDVSHTFTSNLTLKGMPDTQRILANFNITAYNKMSVLQRLLTRGFWEHLKSYGFLQNSHRAVSWLNAHTLNGTAELAPDYKSETPEALRPRVRKQDLTNIFAEINALIDERAAYYPSVGLHNAGSGWPSISIAQLHASVKSNLNSEAEIGFAGSRNTFGVQIESGYGLSRAKQLLNLKQLSPFPPIKERDSMLHEHVRYEAKWESPFEPVRNYVDHRIDCSTLLSELKEELVKFIENEILTPGWASDGIGVENEIPIWDVESLLCINDDEWNYLPLWADGLDDGTGGVFAEQNIPDLGVDEGFRGGKRGLGCKLDDLADIEMGEDGYSIVDGSEFEDIATDDGISTIGKASKVVTVGTRNTASTVMSLDE